MACDHMTTCINTAPNLLQPSLITQGGALSVRGLRAECSVVARLLPTNVTSKPSLSVSFIFTTPRWKPSEGDKYRTGV